MDSFGIDYKCLPISVAGFGSLKSLHVKLCKVAQVIVSLAKFMEIKGVIYLGYIYRLGTLDLMFS